MITISGTASWSIPAGDLDPFQCRPTQFVARVVCFEKVIAWAQADKTETLAEAGHYTSSTAQTGRLLAGPGREHDWGAAPATPPKVSSVGAAWDYVSDNNAPTVLDAAGAPPPDQEAERDCFDLRWG